MSAVSGQRLDPEDGTHTLANYVVFRLCDVIAAALYVTAVPWERTGAWFAVVVCAGSLRYWNANRPGFMARPIHERRRLYNAFTWLHMIALGSAGYFLYLPDDLMMLTLLGVQLFGTAGVAAVRLSADSLRAVVSVCLILLPMSLRAVAEGALHGRMLVLLSGLGIVFTLTLVRASRLHQQILDQQFEQRQRAERAADAVASVSLAKSRFFAAVSHDLRQPVHAIGLYLEPLVRLSRAAGTADSQRAVDGIRACWKALDGLLAQVLDLTRMDAGVTQAWMEPVDLARVVRGIVLQHGAVAEQAGLRLVALADQGRFALADELMLKRVLSNLVDNAIKFSRRGGTVAIAVRSGRGRWRLQVRDAGQGMPAEAQERIFEDFVQLDNDDRNRRKGHGLGLAISRRFTELMGAQLAVRSAPRRGTTMTVVLQQAPLPHAQGRQPIPHAASTFLDSSSDGHSPAADLFTDGAQGVDRLAQPADDVLIVEDDLLVAEAMRQILESWGHRVRHVPTGTEALANTEFGRIAICDVRLPMGPSGLQVALALRDLGKRVLLVSGETDLQLRESAALHGLTLLIKPVSGARLRSALQQGVTNFTPRH